MKLFKALNQPDFKTCLPTCMAMIIGESVGYVLQWFKHYGGILHGYVAEDAIIFLAHHGVYLATYAAPVKEGEFIELTRFSTFEVGYRMNGRPALLTVMSERFIGKLHSVFWDGKVVLDPNPKVKEPRKLESYEIKEVWPLMMTEERSQRTMKRWKESKAE